MRTLAAIVAMLALSACVSHNFSEGRRDNWRCDDGKAFSLRTVGEAVEVYASGVTHRMQPSGENQYADGDVAYAVERGRATLTGVHGGPFVNCRRSGWF